MYGWYSDNSVLYCWKTLAFICDRAFNRDPAFIGLGTPAFIKDPAFIWDSAFNRSFMVGDKDVGFYSLNGSNVYGSRGGECEGIHQHRG